jgi:hypothetical protein
VIQIDEAPNVHACSTCMSPLTWIYVYHLQKTVAVVPMPGPDRMNFRLHTCPLKPGRTWKHVQIYPPRVAHRGAARARAELEANKARRKPIETLTEEK